MAAKFGVNSEVKDTIGFNNDLEALMGTIANTAAFQMLDLPEYESYRVSDNDITVVGSRHLGGIGTWITVTIPGYTLNISTEEDICSIEIQM
jgi:hypothetical protein